MCWHGHPLNYVHLAVSLSVFIRKFQFIAYHSACRTQFGWTDCISSIAPAGHVTSAIGNYVLHIHNTEGAYQYVQDSFTVCEMRSGENWKATKLKAYTAIPLRMAAMGSVQTNLQLCHRSAMQCFEMLCSQVFCFHTFTYPLERTQFFNWRQALDLRASNPQRVKKIWQTFTMMDGVWQ
jgi:hypothetical protein